MMHKAEVAVDGWADFAGGSTTAATVSIHTTPKRKAKDPKPMETTVCLRTPSTNDS